MSSYTQPVAYVNGNNLNADTIINNEESLKEYINQEIVTADIAAAGLKQENISRGSIVRNNAEFISSHISGIANLQLPLNRSYSTSTTKNNSQTSSIQWQDISNCACLVSAHSTAYVIITLYIKYRVDNNTTTASNGGQGAGLWQNEIRIKRVNVETGEYSLFATTDNYCFEGAGTSADTLDPGADLENANERSVMTVIRSQVTKGEYYYLAAVNPHNETGYTTVKSMTAEVFYI
jgi:hypothetical protein